MATNDILTLAEAKAHLNITGSGSDTKVAALVTAASMLLDAAAKTFFVKRSVVELHWPRGKFLFPRARPVNSITSILDPAGNSVPAADYYLDTDRSFIAHVGYWPTAVNATNLPVPWSVTLSAGWFANTAAVAEDVKQACRLRLSAIWDRPNPDVSSVGVGGLSVSYGSAPGGGMAAELTDTDRLLLAQYINEVM